MRYRHDNPFSPSTGFANDFATDPTNAILRTDAELLGTTEPLTTPVRYTAPGNDVVATQRIDRSPDGNVDTPLVADRLEQYSHPAAPIGHAAVEHIVSKPPMSAAERIAAIDASIDNHTPESPMIGQSKAVNTIGRLNPDNLIGR